MKKIITLAITATLFFAPAMLKAQDSTNKKSKVERMKNFKDKVENATPEQKAKAKEFAEKRKERIANMTPEEKEKRDVKKKEMEEKLSKMTPEEKEKATKKMKEKKEKREGKKEN
jgi:hypothetical protein